jgi:hypothetical protein
VGRKIFTRRCDREGYDDVQSTAPPRVVAVFVEAPLLDEGHRTQREGDAGNGAEGGND